MENVEKEHEELVVVEEIPGEKITQTPEETIKWTPRTQLGRQVHEGKITTIEEVFDLHVPILEPQIVDKLLVNAESDLLLIGQAKGKFGGGQRRVFRQTQKKTAEGNKPNFAACAVVGNRNGYVGIGYGKSKETVPARDKAIRRAKLNIIRIRRGCGSWQCGCKQPHSIPYAVEGKCGAIKIRLIPGPKGKGLIIQEELKKILKLAGIQDVWSKTYGNTHRRLNLVKACMAALQKLVETKVKAEYAEQLGMCEGKYEK